MLFLIQNNNRFLNSNGFIFNVLNVVIASGGVVVNGLNNIDSTNSLNKCILLKRYHQRNVIRMKSRLTYKSLKEKIGDVIRQNKKFKENVKLNVLKMWNVEKLKEEFDLKKRDSHEKGMRVVKGYDKSISELTMELSEIMMEKNKINQNEMEKIFKIKEELTITSSSSSSSGFCKESFTNDGIKKIQEIVDNSMKDGVNLKLAYILALAHDEMAAKRIIRCKPEILSSSLKKIHSNVLLFSKLYENDHVVVDGDDNQDNESDVINKEEKTKGVVKFKRLFEKSPELLIYDMNRDIIPGFELLKRYDLKNGAIASIAITYPKFFCQVYLKDIKNNFGILYEIGFKDEDIALIILKNVKSLMTMTKDDITNHQMHFKLILGISSEEYINLIIKYPKLLNNDTTKNMNELIEYLKFEFRININKIKEKSMRYPKLLTLTKKDFMNIENWLYLEVNFSAKEIKFRFPELIHLFCTNLDILKLRLNQLGKEFKALSSSAYRQEALKSLIQKEPSILSISNEIIKPRISYIYKLLNLNLEDQEKYDKFKINLLIKNPILLHFKSSEINKRYIKIKNAFMDTDEAIVDLLLQRNMSILTMVPNKIIQKIKLIIFDLKRDPKELLKYPDLLNISLEKNIKPRINFIKELKYNSNHLDLKDIFFTGDPYFSECVIKSRYDDFKKFKKL